MPVPYLVTGNNLFRQWFSNESVLENFENWSTINSMVPCGFNIKQASLVNICWSYNVFQDEDGYYVTGAWADSDKIVTKLDIFKEPVNLLDFITTCNDFNIFIVDTKLLKMWALDVGGALTCTPLDLSFEFGSSGMPQNLKVSKVITSNNCVTFLTNSGHVFDGLPPTYLDTSHCIGEVCDIVCGYDHSILLTTAGHVYTWGCGQRLQLGHGDITSVASPTEVKALSGLKIVKIAAGGVHSMALSEFGDVYAWGWNEDGQLGVKPEHESTNCLGVPSCAIPTVVDIIDENGQQVESNVVDIACGSKHSVIKLDDNSVWGTGCNKYGQLGLPSQNYPVVKYFRKLLQCDFDFEIMCGTWTTVILKK